MRPPRLTTILLILAAASPGQARDFTGPEAWYSVQSNAISAWQQKAEQGKGPSWRGVVADRQRREVRLLAEAVGHRSGTIVEFMLVGPLSDRAYEALGVTVAQPGDIVRAVESLGVAKGSCRGSDLFSFWPLGERIGVTLRSLDGKNAHSEIPLGSIVKETPDTGILSAGADFIFTAARWQGATCVSDTNMPAAVFSLYNDGTTVLDLPEQLDQGAAYGRFTTTRQLKHGELLEVILRPQLPPDGTPRVLRLEIRIIPDSHGLVAKCSDSRGTLLKEGDLSALITWLQEQSASGRDPFVKLHFDEELSLRQAQEVARLFEMLDGQGVKMEGKAPESVYYKAFLPRERWRDRKERLPQPFELHIGSSTGSDSSRKLIFIEEDWNVAGLDPRLTPREYPFEKWSELPQLIAKAGGQDNKSHLLFVYAPLNAKLSQFMPGIRQAAARLPLVYIFQE